MTQIYLTLDETNLFDRKQLGAGQNNEQPFTLQVAHLRANTLVTIRTRCSSLSTHPCSFFHLELTTTRIISKGHHIWTPSETKWLGFVEPGPRNILEFSGFLSRQV